MENTAGIRSETSQLGVLLPAMASFQETIGMVYNWYRYCLVSVKPRNFVQLKPKFIFIIIIANVSHLQYLLLLALAFVGMRWIESSRSIWEKPLLSSKTEWANKKKYII